MELVSLEICIPGCKNEAEATTAFMKHIKENAHNARMYKIRDIGNTYKPCDAIFVSEQGAVMFVEFKQCKTKKVPDAARAMSKLEPHQYLTLSSIDSVGHDKLVAALIVYHNQSGIFYSLHNINERSEKENV